MARLEPQSESTAGPEINLEQTLRECLFQLTAWLLDKGLELEFDVEPGDYILRVSAAALTNASNLTVRFWSILLKKSVLAGAAFP